MVPPNFLTILISLKSTLSNFGSDKLGSNILRTASTAIGESSLEFEETTFDDKAVLTQVMSLSLLFKSIFSLISSKI